MPQILPYKALKNINKEEIGKISSFSHEYADPNKFLACDGSEVLRVDYPELFSKIGEVYGAGDGVTTFLLPDMRGKFTRGVDDGAGVDNGRVLGTYQDDSLQGHQHYYQARHNTNAGSNISLNDRLPLGTYGTYGYIDDGHGAPRISDETRPKNVAVKFYIRYTS